MVDSGATGRSFIDETFAQKHDLAFHALEFPRVIKVVDGRRISSGAITHTVRTPFTIGSHTEILDMFVTKLGRYPIILGIPWLRSHNPSMDWEENYVTFQSKFCRSHYLSNRREVSVEGYLEPLKEESKSLNAAAVQVRSPATSVAPEVTRETKVVDRSLIQNTGSGCPAVSCLVTARSVAPEVHVKNPARSVTPEVHVPCPARSVTPEVTRENHALPRSKRDCRKITPKPSKLDDKPKSQAKSHVEAYMALSSADNNTQPKTLDISLINAAPFNVWLKRSRRNPEFQVFTASMKDIKKALAPKIEVDPAGVLPKEYHEFLDVFSRKEAE